MDKLHPPASIEKDWDLPATESNVRDVLRVLRVHDREGRVVEPAPLQPGAGWFRPHVDMEIESYGMCVKQEERKDSKVGPHPGPSAE